MTEQSHSSAETDRQPAAWQYRYSQKDFWKTFAGGETGELPSDAVLDYWRKPEAEGGMGCELRPVFAAPPQEASEQFTLKELAMRARTQSAPSDKPIHAIGWALWHPEHGVAVTTVRASEVQAQDLLNRHPKKGWKAVPVAVEHLPDYCNSDQGKCGKLSWPWCSTCPHAGFGPITQADVLAATSSLSRPNREGTK